MHFWHARNLTWEERTALVTPAKAGVQCGKPCTTPGRWCTAPTQPPPYRLHNSGVTPAKAGVQCGKPGAKAGRWCAAPTQPPPFRLRGKGGIHFWQARNLTGEERTALVTPAKAGVQCGKPCTTPGRWCTAPTQPPPFRSRGTGGFNFEHARNLTAEERGPWQ
jgi:hypothetical protein